MAPSLRRTVAAATIAAAAAATAAHAAVDVYPYGGSVTAERLARAIVHKFQHTGSRGAIRYVKGSAELLGFDQDPPYPNKELQTGFVQTGEALLPESAGSAVCFTSGPISNLVTGNRDKFPTIDTFIITENYFSLDGGPWTLQDIIGGLQTFSLEPLLGLSDRGYTWGNSVALKFHVKAVESTTVTNEWAFCSNRPLNALTGAFDAGAIAYEGLGGTPARTLLNPGTFRNKDSDPTSCFSEFQDEGTANEPGNGDQYGLPKFTNALGVENAMYCTTRTSEFAVEAGEYYEIQYTASNQNGVGNAGEESAAFLFVASSFAPDYPDIYEPSDADWTGTETTQEVDRWCVFASDVANDFAPGFRVTSVEAGDTQQYCCRQKGRFDPSQSTCVVKDCSGTPYFEHTSYIVESSPNANSDCYALCKPRDAFTGNEPYIQLPPALTALLDAREQIVELYDAPSYLSGFAYLDGSRDRHGIVITEQGVSSTGVRVSNDGGITEYVCLRRGTYTGSGTAVFDCKEYTDSFFIIGADTVGAEAVTDCYTALEE